MLYILEDAGPPPETEMTLSRFLSINSEGKYSLGGATISDKHSPDGATITDKYSLDGATITDKYSLDGATH